MHRLLGLIVFAMVLGLSLSASSFSAGTANAAGCVSITKVYFDSPGSDYGSNASLNAEWVRVHNRCTTNKSLSGWTVRDPARHVYHFGTYTLKAGASVRIHTGKGTNTSTDRYWGSGWYVWNNTGDKAILKNGAGTTVDTCAFSGAGDWASC
jgi:hypothetical protein